MPKNPLEGLFGKSLFGKGLFGKNNWYLAIFCKDFWTILIDYGKSCYWRIVRRSSHWFHFGKSGVFSNHLRRAVKSILTKLFPNSMKMLFSLWTKMSILKKSLNWMKCMYKKIFWAYLLIKICLIFFALICYCFSEKFWVKILSKSRTTPSTI